MKSTRILVLGSTGMLGHMVSKVLAEETAFTVHGTHISDRDDPYYFDAEKGLDRLASIYRESGGYDYAINCIGFTADRMNPGVSLSLVKAIKLNSLFPHRLAEFALERETRVIHISTDAVFSNVAGRCSEDAPHDCTDAYGKTKSLGEVVNENFWNVRCSIIGPSPFEKRGLLEWFRSQPEGQDVQGYTNHLWNGVTTLQFAQLCKRIIKNNEFGNVIRESHVHHFCPNKEVTKYDLLRMFNKMLENKYNILRFENKALPLNRVLTSRYCSLRNIFGCNKDMHASVRELFDSIMVS